MDDLIAKVHERHPRGAVTTEPAAFEGKLRGQRISPTSLGPVWILVWILVWVQQEGTVDEESMLDFISSAQ